MPSTSRCRLWRRRVARATMRLIGGCASASSIFSTMILGGGVSVTIVNLAVSIFSFSLFAKSDRGSVCGSGRVECVFEQTVEGWRRFGVIAFLELIDPGVHRLRPFVGAYG